MFPTLALITVTITRITFSLTSDWHLFHFGKTQPIWSTCTGPLWHGHWRSMVWPLTLHSPGWDGHRQGPGACLWCWHCQCLWREGHVGTVLMKYILSPEEPFPVLQSCKSQRRVRVQPLRGHLLPIWDDTFCNEGLGRGGRSGWLPRRRQSSAVLLHHCQACADSYEMACWATENKQRFSAKEIKCWILKLKPWGRASQSHH